MYKICYCLETSCSIVSYANGKPTFIKVQILKSRSNKGVSIYMSEKALSEQEWVYNYLKSKKSPVPLVLGTRGLGA